MIFVKTFKGYEDKVQELDLAVNGWVEKYKVDVLAVQTALSHEQDSRAGSGDLIYTVAYRADAPVQDEPGESISQTSLPLTSS